MKQNQTINTLTLGKDISVNRLGFGAMRITGKGGWGEPNDKQAVIQVLRRAVQLGINFIDTADVYGPEVSENLIAEALYPYADDLVIATKGGMMRPEKSQWVKNGKPAHLRLACEASLKRLKLERIDLYQLHRIDPDVPVAEQIGVLQDLRAEGKIKHIGLSEVSLEQLRCISDITPIVSVQNKYNLQERQSEEVLKYCTEQNIAFIPYAPLTVDSLIEPGSPLNIIAQGMSATPKQIALAWLLHKSSCMLPIPGTGNVDHLEENIKAAFLKIDQSVMNLLNSEIMLTNLSEQPC